nr:U17_MYRTX_Sd1b [Stenamma debile]
MEKGRTSMFSTYLMMTFLLISTFITMVVTESYIIDAPSRKCPEGSRRSTQGECRTTSRG